MFHVYESNAPFAYTGMYREVCTSNHPSTDFTNFIYHLKSATHAVG